MTPAGGEGLRIREVVDIDFGSDERRGYQRLIPNDFGAPDRRRRLVARRARRRVGRCPTGDETRIRVGDPAVDEHRAAPLRPHLHAPGRPALDRRAGARHHRQRRDAGHRALRDRRRRPRARGPAVQRRLVRRNPAGATSIGCRRHVPRRDRGRSNPAHGITIGGRITERHDTTGRCRAAAPAPHLREPSSARRSPWCRSGLASGGAAYLWSRRRGRNEVFAGGAADAAYGRHR